MKKLLLTITVLLFYTIVYSQINVSTIGRDDQIFNTTTSEYEPWKKNTNEVTFFTFNEDSPTIKHVTEFNTSVYIVESEKEEIKDKLYTLNIRDNNGSKYYMILNMQDRNIRVVYEYSGSIFMTQYNIRTIWKN